LLMQDNSTCKLQCTSFLKLGSHYPPLRGIVQLTNSATPIVTFRLFAFGIGVSTIKRLIKYLSKAYNIRLFFADRAFS
jgi:hypothetical protein